MQEASLFFCTPPPAFKLQKAISGCFGAKMFLLVPVIYNAFKTWWQQPEKLLTSVKQSVTERLLHKMKI